MTTKEASLKWGMSVDKVRAKLCHGEVPGAEKVNGIWVIPDDAQPLSEDEVKIKNEMEKETANKNETKALIIAVVAGVVLAFSSIIAVANDATTFGFILMFAASGILGFLGSSFFPKISFTVQAVVIFIILFIISCSVVYVPSNKSSSDKSYAEEYGYSVEDFYYKGSDGLWYKK